MNRSSHRPSVVVVLAICLCATMSAAKLYFTLVRPQPAAQTVEPLK